MPARLFLSNSSQTIQFTNYILSLTAKGSWIPRLIRFLVLTGLSGFCECLFHLHAQHGFDYIFAVILVMLAVLLENSGLMKAGPRQAEFEPVQGKTYKFSDVHGVDEAKDVNLTL